jgi:hypothetical protein
MSSLKDKLPYPDVGTELEYSPRKDYFKLIRNLTEEDILKKPESYLEDICNIYKKIESSKPPFGKEVEWAGEMIRVYRNLGYLISILKDNLEDIEMSTNLESTQEELDDLNEKINSLREI